MIITRKFKLDPSKEQKQILLDTISQYKQAIDKPLKFGFKNKQVSGIELHKAAYYDLRKSTKLPSQLICSARCKATEILKAIKTQTKGKFNTKQPISKKFPTIRFDRNSCSITDRFIKMSTTNGRIQVPIIQYDFTKNIKWTSIQKTCELQYKYLKNEFYLIIFIEIQEPQIQPPKDILGIDRGCKYIAVCSNNIFFDSRHLRNIKGKYNYLRKRLSSKGTKSSRRLLRKISGREHRFVRDVNHVISKNIVSMPFDTFVFEKLNIRRKREQGKRFNSILNGWSYYQLEQFVKYKAALAGKQVAYVDARYTSQKCSKCNHIERSNRKSQSLFCCKQCNFTLNADLNASRNIKQNFIATLSIPLSSGEQSISHTVRGCSTQVQAP